MQILLRIVSRTVYSSCDLTVRLDSKTPQPVSCSIPRSHNQTQEELERTFLELDAREEKSLPVLQTVLDWTRFLN